MMSRAYSEKNQLYNIFPFFINIFTNAPGLFTKFEEVLQEISPHPKCKIIRQRKRKVQRAEVLTASPFKKRLLKEIAYN